MALKVQLRRGTAAEWTSANPTLMSGEMGVETDTLKVKIGNGTTAWNSLQYFTQGAQGIQGPQGPQGIQGIKGDVGETGPANTLSIGTVTTGAAGSSVVATITGTAPNQTLNLTIPKGDKGNVGDAATITVGTVTALSAGSAPTVTNVGTSGAAVFDFGIPNAVGVPTGGSTGQVLKKTASSTAWSDTALTDNSDVQITSPADKQVLAYESGKWKNKAATGGVTVSDPAPSTPIQGDGWFYAADGTLFVRFTDGNGNTTWIQPNAPLAAQVEQRYYSPNYFVNGGLDINQRGLTSTGTTTTEAFGFDRWALQYSGGTVTYSAQTFSPGTAPEVTLKNYARVVVSGQTGTGQYAILRHPIEDVRTLAGETVTVSFWAKAASGTPTVALVPRQDFGTGGSPSAATDGDVNGAQSIVLSGGSVWTRYSKTFVMPSVSGKTLGTTENTSSVTMRFWLSGSSTYNAFTGSLPTQNNTFEFAGFQLEKGSTATAFRRNANSLQGELAACQRYYWRSTPSGVYTVHGHALGQTTSQVHGTFRFPVTMRTAPTSVDWAQLLVWNNVNTWPVSSVAYYDTFMGTNYSGVTITVTSSGITNGGFYTIINNNNSSGYIGFSAEL